MSRAHALVIEHLAADECGLIEELIETRAGRAAYQELAKAAIKLLREVTLDRDRRRDECRRLRDENSRLRGQIRRADAEREAA